MTTQTTSTGNGSLVAGIPSDSWLTYAITGRRLLAQGGNSHHALSGMARIQTESGALDGVEVAADIGNDTCKIALIGRQDSIIKYVRTSATYQPAATITYGELMETWQERLYDDKQARQLATQYADDAEAISSQYSEEFCIGEDALSGDSLPTGPTDQRLNEPRYLRFIKAVLIQGLIAAGYPAGSYHISLALGVRNEEITERRVLPQTLEAIKKLKHPYTIMRTDHAGKTHTWSICIQEIYPYPQTFGGFYALDTDLVGRALLPHILKFLFVDIGGFDLHILEVLRLAHGVRATGKRVSGGTVEIARALAAELKKPGNYPLIGELKDAEAQRTLMSGKILLGGQEVEISPIMKQIRDSRGGNLLATALSPFQRADGLFVFEGGGSISLASEIRDRMATMQRSEAMFLTLDPTIAALANVVGLLALLNIRKRPRER